MKPTPTQIEAACAAVILGEDQHGNPVHLQPSEAEAVLSAALSVPASAVVGDPEPIGYCSEYGLDKLASQAHHYCLSVSKAQENEFQFPIYASRISQQDAELERLRREVEALRVLSFSGNALVQIVEGLQGSMEHGTWRDEKGMRLKDTNAWCLFYTTFKASAQAAKAEDTAR